MWRYEAPYIVNERGKVLDVDGQIDAEGRHIAATARNGNIAQHWDIVFVDDWKGEPGKGELNEQFGLYVERPFHVISQLPSNRYLDLIGRDFVIKTQNARNTQVWWFDQKSLTIKS